MSIVISRGIEPDSLAVSIHQTDICFNTDELYLLQIKPHFNLERAKIHQQGELLWQKLHLPLSLEGESLSIQLDEVTCKFPWYSLIEHNPSLSIIITGNANHSAKNSMTAPTVQSLMLLVIINGSYADTNETILNYESEYVRLQQLAEQLSSPLKVIPLRNPNKKNLDKALSDLKPHIVHYIGHTYYQLNLDHVVFRVTADNTSGYEEVTLSHLFSALSDVTKLVYFNACQSAFPTSQLQHSLYWAAIQKGVSALGFTFPVADAKAIYSDLFYLDYFSHGLASAVKNLNIRMINGTKEAPPLSIAVHGDQPDFEPIKLTNVQTSTPSDNSRIERFIGRDNVLHKIHQLFEQGKTTINLYGPQGCGKSAVIHRYAQQFNHQLSEENSLEAVLYRLVDKNNTLMLVESRKPLSVNALKLLTTVKNDTIGQLVLPEFNHSEVQLFKKLNNQQISPRKDKLNRLDILSRITNPAILTSQQFAAQNQLYKTQASHLNLSSEQTAALHFLIASPVDISTKEIQYLTLLKIIPAHYQQSLQTLMDANLICCFNHSYSVYTHCALQFSARYYPDMSTEVVKNNLNKLCWFFEDKSRKAEQARNTELAVYYTRQAKSPLETLGDSQKLAGNASAEAILLTNLPYQSTEDILTRAQQGLEVLRHCFTDDPDFAPFAIAQSLGLIALRLKRTDYAREQLLAAVNLLPKVNLIKRESGFSRATMLYRALADCYIEPKRRIELLQIAKGYCQQDYNHKDADSIQTHINILLNKV